MIYSLKSVMLIKEIEGEKNNGKISSFHELEKLILLQCPYYPNSSIDSMEYLSEFQWHVFFFLFLNIEEKLL